MFVENQTFGIECNSPEVVELLHFRLTGIYGSEQRHVRFGRPYGVPFEHRTEYFEEVGFGLFTDNRYAVIEGRIDGVERSPMSVTRML